MTHIVIILGWGVLLWGKGIFEAIIQCVVVIPYCVGKRSQSDLPTTLGPLKLGRMELKVLTLNVW